MQSKLSIVFLLSGFVLLIYGNKYTYSYLFRCILDSNIEYTRGKLWVGGYAGIKAKTAAMQIAAGVPG
jgi:hypothetical protein